MNENKIGRFLKEHQTGLILTGGIAIGVVGMLIFRKYEMARVGKGIAKIVLNPEKLEKIQSMARALEAVKRV